MLLLAMAREAERKKEGPGSRGSLERSPGRLISTVNHRLRLGVAAVFEREGHNISIEQWILLAALGFDDGITQLELGERVSKSRHHTSKLVASLEERALVSRKADAKDARLWRVVLTVQGRAARKALAPLVERYVSDVFEGVSKRDFEGFMTCLEHALAVLPANGKEDE